MDKIWKNTSLIKKFERKDQRGYKVALWLRPHSPYAGGMCLIPGQETKISSHITCPKQKK